MRPASASCSGTGLGGRIWAVEADSAMGALAVVVVCVDPQDSLELATANDHQPDQTLRSDGVLMSGHALGLEDLSAQDAQLVAQQQDLDLLALTRAAEQNHQFEHPAKRQVQQ
jgi:hypothetical protein